MPREYKAYFRDIFEAIAKIERYTKNMKFDDFANDELVQDGVIRNLEIIGETVKNLPRDIKKNYPEVEWRKIAESEGYSYSCVLWCRLGGYMGYSLEQGSRIKENCKKDGFRF